MAHEYFEVAPDLTITLVLYSSVSDLYYQLSFPKKSRPWQQIYSDAHLKALHRKQGVLGEERAQHLEGGCGLPPLLNHTLRVLSQTVIL